MQVAAEVDALRARVARQQLRKGHARRSYLSMITPLSLSLSPLSLSLYIYIYIYIYMYELHVAAEGDALEARVARQQLRRGNAAAYASDNT